MPLSWDEADRQVNASAAGKANLATAAGKAYYFATSSTAGPSAPSGLSGPSPKRPLTITTGRGEPGSWLRKLSQRWQALSDEERVRHMGGEAPPQAPAPPQRAPSDPGQHGTSQGKARVTELTATASVHRAIGVPTYRYPDDVPSYRYPAPAPRGRGCFSVATNMGAEAGQQWCAESAGVANNVAPSSVALPEASSGAGLSTLVLLAEAAELQARSLPENP